MRAWGEEPPPTRKDESTATLAGPRTRPKAAPNAKRKESKEPAEPKEANDAKDAKEAKASKEAKETKKRKDAKVAKETKVKKEPKAVKKQKESKDTKEKKTPKPKKEGSKVVKQPKTAKAKKADEEQVAPVETVPELVAASELDHDRSRSREGDLPQQVDLEKDNENDDAASRQSEVLTEPMEAADDSPDVGADYQEDADKQSAARSSEPGEDPNSNNVEEAAPSMEDTTNAQIDGGVKINEGDEAKSLEKQAEMTLRLGKSKAKAKGAFLKRKRLAANHKKPEEQDVVRNSDEANKPKKRKRRRKHRECMGSGSDSDAGTPCKKAKKKEKKKDKKPPTNVPAIPKALARMFPFMPLQPVPGTFLGVMPQVRPMHMHTALMGMVPFAAAAPPPPPPVTKNKLGTPFKIRKISVGSKHAAKSPRSPQQAGSPSSAPATQEPTDQLAGVLASPKRALAKKAGAPGLPAKKPSVPGPPAKAHMLKEALQEGDGDGWPFIGEPFSDDDDSDGLMPVVPAPGPASVAAAAARRAGQQYMQLPSGARLPLPAGHKMCRPSASAFGLEIPRLKARDPFESLMVLSAQRGTLTAPTSQSTASHARQHATSSQALTSAVTQSTAAREGPSRTAPSPAMLQTLLSGARAIEDVFAEAATDQQHSMELLAGARAIEDVFADPTPSALGEVGGLSSQKAGTEPPTAKSPAREAGAAPSKSASTDAAPVEATPVEATPVEATPVEATPVEATPADATPAENTPQEAETAPIGVAHVEAAPADTVPAEATTHEDRAAQAAPAEDADMSPSGAASDEDKLQDGSTTEESCPPSPLVEESPDTEVVKAQSADAAELTRKVDAVTPQSASADSPPPEAGMNSTISRRSASPERPDKTTVEAHPQVSTAAEQHGLPNRSSEEAQPVQATPSVREAQEAAPRPAPTPEQQAALSNLLKLRRKNTSSVTAGMLQQVPSQLPPEQVQMQQPMQPEKQQVVQSPENPQQQVQHQPQQHQPPLLPSQPLQQQQPQAQQEPVQQHPQKLPPLPPPPGPPPPDQPLQQQPLQQQQLQQQQLQQQQLQQQQSQQLDQVQLQNEQLKQQQLQQHYLQQQQLQQQQTQHHQHFQAQQLQLQREQQLQQQQLQQQQLQQQQLQQELLQRQLLQQLHLGQQRPVGLPISGIPAAPPPPPTLWPAQAIHLPWGLAPPPAPAHGQTLYPAGDDPLLLHASGSMPKCAPPSSPS